MANDAHVKILKEGVSTWNKWREGNPDIRPDLTRLNWQNSFGEDLFEEDYFEERFCKPLDFVLYWSSLSRANLSKTNLKWAKLSWADLSEANLSEADLTGAKLSKANLSKANLFLADFSWAKLKWADLSHSHMRWTMLGDADLSEVRGLETVEHSGPSTMGIDSIFRSKGKISEIFLRGVGVPDGIITYMKSLVVNPIEYYSCFISYSSKDEEFAKRLHADLQAVHVRCWFAPEDLKIGERFRPKIDEAIRLHDKLLLVLSKSSVASLWVETEVESAFERERKEGRTVLFPIRLDDGVMETDEAWAADIRRTRHIGDFSKWENDDSYQKGFARLLRDLKAQDKADKKESV
jgi:uncharacterized protein YjbI with pentapeptide repeats